MTPERWQDIKRVLDVALELKPDQRSAYLDQACTSDHSLRQEVQALLDSGDYMRSSFLQSPPRPSLHNLEGFAGTTLSEAPLPDAKVESLLAAHSDSINLSEDPWTVNPAEVETEPKIIGPYHRLKNSAWAVWDRYGS